jgi:hypothetical protein
LVALAAGIFVSSIFASSWEVQAAAPGAARPRFDRRTGLLEPAVAGLVAAVARGDRGEIGHWAERLGPARLKTLLVLEDREIVQAALEAAAGLGGHVRLLGPVAALVRGVDPVVAERAAQVLGQMLGSEDPQKMADWEIPLDEQKRACAALERLGTAPTEPLGARLAALEALAEAHLFCASSAEVATLAADVWPEIRRTVIHSPQMLRLRRSFEPGALAADPVPKVAAAAGAFWCRRNEAALRKGLPAEARPIMNRIRTLLAIEATPVEDAVEMLPCLALSRDPEDRRVLESLRRRRPSPLSDRARELSETGSGSK